MHEYEYTGYKISSDNGKMSTEAACKCVAGASKNEGKKNEQENKTGCKTNNIQKHNNNKLSHTHIQLGQVP